MQLHLEKMLLSCGSPILLSKKEKNFVKAALQVLSHSPALSILPDPLFDAYSTLPVTEKNKFQYIACKEVKCHFQEKLSHVF